MVKLSAIYYSATGHGTAKAGRVNDATNAALDHLAQRVVEIADRLTVE